MFCTIQLTHIETTKHRVPQNSAFPTAKRLTTYYHYNSWSCHHHQHRTKISFKLQKGKAAIV